MKRILVAVLAASLMAVVLLPSAAVAKGPKVDVCHQTGNGSYHLINISAKAVSKHNKHGDGVPGGWVPGMVGDKFFGNNCQVITCTYSLAILGECPPDP